MTNEPEDQESTADNSVLSPDELDITADESVVEIDDGRYVISPSDSEPNALERVETTPDQPSEHTDDGEGTVELSDELVHEWLAERLENSSSKYGFDVTACFEGEVSQRDLFSNDVVTTFENLVVWYANHAGGDTPIEDVLGILLLESNLSVRFPADTLSDFASAHGLEDSDSIGSLLAAAQEAGGFRFPPEDE